MKMLRKPLMLGLLALSLAVPAVQAQTAAAGTAAPAANPVDPGAIQALKDMGAHLQTLKRFQVSTQLTGERVLADGQKLQHTAAATMDVERPNRLHARMSSVRSERELIYDGKIVTLYTPTLKYYSRVELADTLAGLVNRLQERFGVEVPLSDLFVWGTPTAPIDQIQSAMNAGQDFVDNDLCDHYAFRQGALDWQLWITAGAKPLPRKVVITNRSDEARPQSMSLITWNLQPGFKEAAFNFTPPKGSTAVELIPLKTK
jgi:hypothetical protein